MKLLVRLFLFVFPVSLFAGEENSEWFECVINDTDGYTFIRTGPGIENTVIDTVFEHWFFYVYGDTSASWLHVQNPNGKNGYLHKSRVQFFYKLDSLAQHTLLANVFNEIILAEKGNDRVYRNNIYEGRYSPGYYALQKAFCFRPDTSLLRLYFCTLIYESGSADEGKDCVSAEMWLCRPSQVKMVICSLSAANQRCAIIAIKTGMAMSGKEEQFTQQKLEEMYAALDRPCT